MHPLRWPGLDRRPRSGCAAIEAEMEKTARFLQGRSPRPPCYLCGWKPLGCSWPTAVLGEVALGLSEKAYLDRRRIVPRSSGIYAGSVADNPEQWEVTGTHL